MVDDARGKFGGLLHDLEAAIIVDPPIDPVSKASLQDALKPFVGVHGSPVSKPGDPSKTVQANTLIGDPDVAGNDNEHVFDELVGRDDIPSLINLACALSWVGYRLSVNRRGDQARATWSAAAEQLPDPADAQEHRDLVEDLDHRLRRLLA